MRTGLTLQRGFSRGMCSTQMCSTHVERHIWEPSHEILHGQAETRLGWLTIKKVKFLIKLCIVQNPTALNLTNDRYKSLKNIIKHSLGMHRFLVITPEIIQYNIYLYHIYIALVIWSTRKAYCIRDSMQAPLFCTKNLIFYKIPSQHRWTSHCCVSSSIPCHVATWYSRLQLPFFALCLLPVTRLILWGIIV